MRVGEHRRQHLGVEVALVELHLGRPGDRGDHARRGVQVADRGHAAVADRALADRRARRVAAAASESRRSRIGVEPAWAAWPVKVIRWRSTPTVPLTARGQPAGVEQHRPLLDVQLQVGDRALQRSWPPRPRRRGRPRSPPARRRASCRRASVSVRTSSGDERAGARRGADQAAAEARALLVGPVDEAHADRRAVAGSSRSRRIVSSAVSRPSAPSSQPPSGTASMCEPTMTNPSRSPASDAHRLPAASSDGSRPMPVSSTAQPRAGLAPAVGPGQPVGAGEAAAAVARELVEVGDDPPGVELAGRSVTGVARARTARARARRRSRRGRRRACRARTCGARWPTRSRPRRGRSRRS